MTTLSLVSGYIICIFVGLLGLVVLWKIITGSIDLTDLISEENGGASMSRFQFLIFTFVIAISLFLVIVGHPGGPQFPAAVPATILALLGISGSSYLVSKAIQFSDPAGIVDRGSDIIISPVQATVKAGETQQFTANIPQKPGSGVKWEVIAGPGTISNQGLYTAVAAAAAAAGGGGGGGAAPALAGQHATIKVTSDEFPNAYDLAVVTIS
jgi:hypothetical protein